MNPATNREGADEPSIASVEGDLFRAVFDFYQKAITLLRQSSLDEEKLKVAGEAISQVFRKSPPK